MLRPRIIPCLLVHNNGLVKTVKFGDPKYVGDPINAVRIFNEKEVDELFVVDIDATREGREPNYELIRNLAAECRMPLCYGGGVTSAEQIERIVGLGVEKVAMSAACAKNPTIIQHARMRVGGQSIVAVLDVKQSGILRRYECVTHNATRSTKRSPVEMAKLYEQCGAGEIVVNSVDRDGTLKGYDMDLVSDIRQAISLPLTVLGGAGSHDDVCDLIRQHHIIGAAAGSLFVFKGKYRAVLINYPTRQEKDAMLRSAGILG